MDVSRRQFFKICAGGMAGTTVAALGFTPKMALFLNCNNSREVLKNDTAWHRPRKKCYKWQFILRGIQDSHKA